MFLALKIVLFSTQVTALLASYFKYDLYKNTAQKFYLFFLAYVVINESLSYLLSYHLAIRNLFLYNIFTLVSFTFYFYWFYQILKNKRTILWFGSIFLFAVIVSLFTEDFWNTLWSIPLTVGTVFVTIASVMFYLQLLKQDEVENYLLDLRFWLVTGILVFYLGFLPIQLMLEFISTNLLVHRIALLILNILMYGSFVIGFLCLKKK